MKNLRHYFALARVKLSSPGRSLRSVNVAWQVLRTQGWRPLVERVRASTIMYAGQEGAPLGLAIDCGDPLERPLCHPVVARHEAPQVSVIVAAFNNLPYTAACVDAVAKSAGKVSYEIIVADDGSEDGTAEWCRSVENLRHIVTGRGRGFVLNNNRAAGEARGRWLLFLNNDTLMQEGCMEALVDAGSRPGVGAVGAKLIYPDGRLQEAGGVVWRDFEAWNYGREDNPSLPQYNYRRSVDYCSAACLMVDREAFRKVGGFSEDLVPAYGEDSDLCFTLRYQLGLGVIYEPMARVVHFEGRSCGTDPGSGIKKYQVVNRQKLAAKWKHIVSAFPMISPEGVLKAPRRHMGSRTVLMIDSCLPAHDRDSGSRRLETILQILRGLDCHIMFLPENLSSTEPYASDLRRLGVEVLACNAGYRATHEQILRPLLPLIDLVWLVRPEVADMWTPYFRKHRPAAKLIFDTGDIHHLRMRQEERMQGTFREDRSPSEVMRKVETKLVETTDLTVAISGEEKTILEGMGARRVEVVSGIYRDRSLPDDPPFAERHGLLFIGSYQHPPNADGMLWFLEEIWPSVAVGHPDMTLTLLGPEPPQTIRAHASSRVRIPGYVPEVDRYFREARLFVCPLRYGGGIKGKLGQCLEYGLPFVTTPVGADGMGFVHGKDALIAESAGDFAEYVIRLHEEEPLWEKIRLGLGAHLECYSPQRAEEALRRIAGMVPREGRVETA